MRFFHGCSANDLESILESGIKGNDAPGALIRGRVFVTPRADVAFGYASMLGGELNCRGHQDDSERVLLVLDIPEAWHLDNYARVVGGSCPEQSYFADIPAEFISDFVIGDRQQVYSYL